MGRFAFACAALTLMGGCVRASPPKISPPTNPAPITKEDELLPKTTLASFADELALSLEPSKLEDETTATAVFVFNRGSRTWVIALESADDSGERSVKLEVKDPSMPDRALPPAPIGITQQCPRPPSRDVRVIGPGERGLLACVEKLVDVHNVEEIELEADLHFTATDGSVIRVHSPAFRVARRPKQPAKTPPKL